MRNKQGITIAALIVAIIGLSIGFAAFANTLTISSSASVTPDSSNFRVVFSKVSSSEQAGQEYPIVPSVTGVTGATGPIGSTGSQGEIGPTGPQGIPGTSGVIDYADFYALMPPDNAATVAPGTDVSFPQDGEIIGTDITRATSTSFTLTEIGTYQVIFQVSISEAGQLALTLNGAELAYTVVGRATGTDQIVEMAIVTTTSVNSVLTVRNPADNAAALTITPLAGGTEPVSAHLVITQLQ